MFCPKIIGRTSAIAPMGSAKRARLSQWDNFIRIAINERPMPITKNSNCLRKIVKVLPLSESEVTEEADKTITRPRPAKAPVQPRINK
jgi:hypothetical protein